MQVLIIRYLRMRIKERVAQCGKGSSPITRGRQSTMASSYKHVLNIFSLREMTG